MAKGMNKRKEVKKAKKEPAKPAVAVASTKAGVNISTGMPKECLASGRAGICPPPVRTPLSPPPSPRRWRWRRHAAGR